MTKLVEQSERCLLLSLRMFEQSDSITKCDWVQFSINSHQTKEWCWYGSYNYGSFSSRKHTELSTLTDIKWELDWICRSTYLIRHQYYPKHCNFVIKIIKRETDSEVTQRSQMDGGYGSQYSRLPLFLLMYSLETPLACVTFASQQRISIKPSQQLDSNIG